MSAEHCSTCDEYGCPGFTTPRAAPEPLPALRPVRVATDAERTAAITKIRADLAAVRRDEKGAGR